MIYRTRDGHANHYSTNTALIEYKIQLLMLSYVSNIVFIFFIAGAMTEIRDEIGSITVFLWEFVVCLRSFLLCVFVLFSLLFWYSIFSFLNALYRHVVFYVCHTMTALEELNQG
jgi:hypothetical protein